MAKSPNFHSEVPSARFEVPKPWTQNNAGRLMAEQSYLTQSVLEIVLQRSISLQTGQLILDISHGEGKVEGIVGGLTSA